MFVTFSENLSPSLFRFSLSLSSRRAGTEAGGKGNWPLDQVAVSGEVVRHCPCEAHSKSGAEVCRTGTDGARIKGLIVCFLEVGLLAAAITPSGLLSPSTANQHALIAVAFSSRKIIPLNTKSRLSISTDGSQPDQPGSLGVIGLSYCYDLFKFRAFSR